MFKFLNFSIKFFIIFALICLLFAFSTLWYFSIGLPDYKKLSNYQPPISSRVYSDNGKLIAEYALEKRLFIPFESIPKKVIHSFLSAEDKNFFNHPGVDAKGILRAFLKNLKNISENKRLEGASTITQQVAKNFLLTNEVSLKRKIKEAILAFRIERAYSKERILELYLNQIYLGQGTYGIAAASLEYFDKSVKDLSYIEAALLAALPKAPSRYDPFKYPDVAKFRRNLVLQNLEDNNYISKEQFNELKESKIILKRRKIEILNEANSYTEEVRRSIKEKYGFKTLYSEGLSIRTPLDVNYQIQAIISLRNGIEAYDRRHGWRGAITNKIKNPNWEKIIKNLRIDPTLNWKKAEITGINEGGINFETFSGLKGNIALKKLKWAIPNKKNIFDIFNIADIIFVKGENNIWDLKQYPKVNGGIVVLDPHSGDVKALVGGFNFKSSEFNRVTQAKRQPGSAFKPIVYAAALENGLNPKKLIESAGSFRIGKRSIKDTASPGMYDFKRAFKKSSNYYFIHQAVAENHGADHIIRMARQFHLGDRTGLLPEQEVAGQVPSPERISNGWVDGDTANICIGQGEITVTPLQMALMVSTVANGGTCYYPRLVDRIESPDPNERQAVRQFPRARVRSNLFVKQKSLAVVQEAMYADVAEEEGTGRAAAIEGYNVCGKTGTAEVRGGGKITWFASYAPYENPRYAVVVMAENGASGGKTCAPIAKEIFEALKARDERNDIAGN